MDVYKQRPVAALSFDVQVPAELIPLFEQIFREPPTCEDCGEPTPPKFNRCAAGCLRVVCDKCYMRHCAKGCNK